MSTSTAIALAKQSLALLKQRKTLFIFPLLCTLFNLAVLIAALIPLFHIETMVWAHGGYVSPKTFATVFGILLLLFAFLNMTTMLSSAALIACLMKHMNNEPYSLSLGFKTMLKYLARLQRWETYGNILGAGIRCVAYWSDDWKNTTLSKNLLAGLPWNIAITFVIPVILTEKIKTRDAIQRSAALMRNTWGTTNESLASEIQIGTKLILLRIACFIPLIISLIIDHKMGIIIGSTLSTIAIVSVTVLNSATQTTLLTALFLFAIGKDTSRYYDQTLLKKAFRPIKYVIPS